MPLVIDDLKPENPADVEAFSRLNMEWLEEHFVVEPVDHEVLSHPQAHILAPGGHILTAREEGEVIGVCALLKVEQGVYELTKLAVDDRFRGRGIGKKLMESAIRRARRLSANEVIICTNSVLKPAMTLYDKMGFSRVELPIAAKYQRCDTTFQLRF